MTDSGQAGLDEFSTPDTDGGDDGSDGGDRPVEEAYKVAGQAQQDADEVFESTADGLNARYDEPDEAVELAVTQIDYTIEGSGADEQPILHVFGRRPDDDADHPKAEHVRVLGFKPYFYAPTDSLDAPPEQQYDRLTGSRELDRDGEPYESIRGEELTKIFGQTPRDVGQVRDEFDHYEADVLFPNRLLIDRGIKSGVRVPERRADDDSIVVDHEELKAAEVHVDPRVHTMDIEVDDRNGFPEDGEEEIICLTSHDSYADEYVIWLSVSSNLHENVTVPAEIPGYEPIGDGELDVDVRSFTEEDAMLDDYLSYIEETDADVLTGWNFEDFDAPYLLDRLERVDPRSDHNLSIERLSRVSEVWRSNWGAPDVKGRVVFDLLYAYQRRQFTELDSYRLDAVGEQELGVGKERYPGDIGDLWEDDPAQLLEYNLRDVELCVELDRKQEIVDFWQEVASFVGCKLEDAPTPGDTVDMYVLHEVNGEFVLPSKGTVESEEFEGGAVFEPITGVREHVNVLDLKCFSGDTDVLTPDGPKRITEIAVGDPVYTLNPETFECEVHPVAETHEYENSFGEIHHLSGNTHDFKITENHRLLASKRRGWDDLDPDEFEFNEYREFTDTERYAFPSHEPMEGDRPETFDLVEEIDDGHVVVYCDDDLRVFRNAVTQPVRDSMELAHGSSGAMGLTQKVGKYLIPVSTFRTHRDIIEKHADDIFLKYDRQHRELPLSFEMVNWLELLGWFVTEGSINRHAGRVTLHQHDSDGRDAIRALLDRMEINYSTSENGVHISNTFLLDWLDEHCGCGYENKCLPDWTFDLDGELLTVLLETLVAGDGSTTDSGLRKFWTKSDDLKDGIVDIAVRCGEKPTVSKQSDGTWYVSIGKSGSFRKSTNATVKEHEDTVHCITAEENHVVLAGRNGHFQWIGQSLYPMCMVTINASPETKVGEEYDGPTYHAPNDTKFRKDRDGIIREMVDELLTEREEKKARRDEHDPGSEPYERFDQQQGAVKVIMNCFTPDTDVLTPEGVRNIRDLGVGDEVYSIDPDSMTVETKPVVETHAYPEYRGELVDIRTDKTDFRVTPNHRMLVRKNDRNGISEDEWGFVEAGDLSDYCNYELPNDWSYDHGEPLDEVDLTQHLDGDYEVWVRPSVHGRTFTAELGWTPRRVPKDDVGEVGYVFTAAEFEANREYIETVCERSYVHEEPNRKWVPRVYDGDDFLDLLAWYVTEGSTDTSEETQFGDVQRRSSTTVKLAQDQPAVPDGGSDHATIGSLLDRMGLDCYGNERGYQFTSKLLADLLEELCGAGSHEKRIPDLVFDLDERQKRRFLETLVDGDGDRQVNSWRYSTASERLRDDVLRLCTQLGLTASHSHDSGAWRIHVAEDAKHSIRMHRNGSRSTAENGVYCVTVADNHTLLAGRNGTFQFVGQSLYGVTGWEQFRLYDKEAAAAVTATGREVIEHTEQAANELDYQVVYGDSVTGDRPIVVRDSDGIVRIRPIAELFEQAQPHATSEAVVTADGGPVASATVGKQRRTIDGWDALSVSEDGDSEWQPIEQVIRHESDKQVVELQHKFGESATTMDHSYVVEEGDEFVEAPPNEVETPLRVPGVPETDSIEMVDVYDVLHGYERDYEDGRGTGGTTTKTKRIHANDEHVWFGHEHYDELESTIKVQRYIEPGTDEFDGLLRLLAAYITEGSASTKETTDAKFGVSISESRAEWLEQLQTDYYRLFTNTTASIIDSDSGSERTVSYDVADGAAETTYDDETLKLQMMNELAAVFFREFAGQTSRGKRIPGFMFNLSDSAQDRFLGTLIEGDGSRAFPRYSEAYADEHFDYETTSRELAGGLSMLLTQRDRKHSLKYRAEKDSYTIRTCESYRSGRDPVLTEIDHDGYVYDLSVARNNNFVDAVGGIVLHNTDSVMLESGDIDPNDVEGGVEVTDEMREIHPEMDDSELRELAAIIERGFEIEELINASYDEFASTELNAEEHRFQIEFEKLYRRFFQAGKKKRYAGHIVWKEGKDVDDIDITGFEYQRSDIAPITKEVQHEVIERIVRGDEIEDVKEYVHDVIEEFQTGEMDVDRIGIPGGIGKRLDNYDTDTAQVRGAKYANMLLGTNFDRGSKPKRLYLDGVHPEFFRRMEDEEGLDPQRNQRYREFKTDPDVICFEYADQLPDEFNIDWDKMLEKTLKGPIERILEALDVSWDEVESGQTQTGLGSYT